MSRMFSTTARRIKNLFWKLNGTTKNVDWAKSFVEEAIDQVPGLSEKVDGGMINGDPHSTGDDPLHASGVIGKKSLKGQNRVSSFHVYPDGVVRFSNKALGELNVHNPSVPADTGSSTTKEPANEK